jgi:hypothetical protein
MELNVGDATPLLVQARSFFSLSMGQSTSSPGQMNTITLTLAINSPLDAPAVSKITIFGLTGSVTGSVNSLLVLPIKAVGTPSAINIFGASGLWNKTAGSLVLTLAAGQSIAAATPIVFSFDLQNPATEQSAPATSIKAECVHSDATLYYTTDGSQASSASNKYATVVALTTGQTVKVVASYDEQLNSEQSSATYS